MRYLFAILFLLLLSPSTQGQALQGKAEGVGVALADTLHSRMYKAKSHALDTIKNKTPLLPPNLDSTALKQARQHAQDIAKDSLQRVSEPVLGHGAIEAIKVEAIKYQADSTLVDKLKLTAMQTARDSLNQYVDAPHITIDSTTADQIKRETKQKAETALERATGLDVPAITPDSTFRDQIKQEVKSQSKTALEKEIKTEIPVITLDSTTTTQLKVETERRAENAINDTKEYKSLENLPKDTEVAKLEDYKGKLGSTWAAMQAKYKRPKPNWGP